MAAAGPSRAGVRRGRGWSRCGITTGNPWISLCILSGAGASLNLLDLEISWIWAVQGEFWASTPGKNHGCAVAQSGERIYVHFILYYLKKSHQSWVLQWEAEGNGGFFGFHCFVFPQSQRVELNSQLTKLCLRTKTEDLQYGFIYFFYLF